jgi:hypothetical protein
LKGSAAVSGKAQSEGQLVRLINAYRAAAGFWEGRQVQPAGPLTPHPD